MATAIGKHIAEASSFAAEATTRLYIVYRETHRKREIVAGNRDAPVQGKSMDRKQVHRIIVLEWGGDVFVVVGISPENSI